MNQIDKMKTLHKEQWAALESAARKSDSEIARLNSLLTAEQAKVAELAGALEACEACLNANFAAPGTIEGHRAMVAMNTARQALSRAGGAK